MGMAYIMKLNTIQGTRGYEVFECNKLYGSYKAKHTFLNHSTT